MYQYQIKCQNAAANSTACLGFSTAEILGLRYKYQGNHAQRSINGKQHEQQLSEDTGSNKGTFENC